MTTPNHTPTPETDALCVIDNSRLIYGVVQHRNTVPASFARSLERRLATAAKDLDYAARLENVVKQYGEEAKIYKAKIAAKDEEIKRLSEELEKVKQVVYDFHGGLPDDDAALAIQQIIKLLAAERKVSDELAEGARIATEEPDSNVDVLLTALQNHANLRK